MRRCFAEQMFATFDVRNVEPNTRCDSGGGNSCHKKCVINDCTCVCTAHRRLLGNAVDVAASLLLLSCLRSNRLKRVHIYSDDDASSGEQMCGCVRPGAAAERKRQPRTTLTIIAKCHAALFQTAFVRGDNEIAVYTTQCNGIVVVFPLIHTHTVTSRQNKHDILRNMCTSTTQLIKPLHCTMKMPAQIRRRHFAAPCEKLQLAAPQAHTSIK